MNAGVPGRFRTLGADPCRNAVEPNETWSVRVGVAAWPSHRPRRAAMPTKRSGAAQGGAPRLSLRLCRRPKTDARAEAGPSPPKGEGHGTFVVRAPSPGPVSYTHLRAH